jgi:putative component of membrane protein insertase Oxa1/YidC/SpoIIIJ protein YidD
MSNVSLTTAAIIGFTEELEDKSSAFYDELTERWPENKEPFQTFSKDGGKNKVWVIRTYQETISDALEANFCFEGLNLDDYAVETTLAEDASYVDALKAAIALEGITCAFYQEVAKRSESLLATIPMAFKRVAKKRGKRKAKLESLLGAIQTEGD